MPAGTDDLAWLRVNAEDERSLAGTLKRSIREDIESMAWIFKTWRKIIENVLRAITNRQ